MRTGTFLHDFFGFFLVLGRQGLFFFKQVLFSPEEAPGLCQVSYPFSVDSPDRASRAFAPL